MSKLPLEELKAKARLVLRDEDVSRRSALVVIASSANSPTAAYEQSYLESGDAKLAKACRFLAMVKRDHGKKAFDQLVSSEVSQPSTPQEKGTDKSEKGKDNE